MQFTCDQRGHTEEDDRNASVRIVTVDVNALVLDVTHGEKVKLLLSSATGGIDRKQNGPGDARAQETQDDHDLEEAYKKVTVNRLVIQNVLILEILEVLDPSKHSTTRRWGLSPLPKVIEVRSRRIDATEVPAEDKKGCDEGSGKNCCRYQRRDEGRQAVRRISGFASLSTLS